MKHNFFKWLRTGSTIFTLFTFLTLGVGQMWADDAITVYCAIPASSLKSGDACYSLKVNANIGDNNTWRQAVMTKTNKTYNGKLVYSGTFNIKYGGVDALQFQIYEGDTWKSQKQPYSSWSFLRLHSEGEVC